MLAMDTTGPLEYDLLRHGVLIIYIHLFVQKLTQNYNKRTSNKKKQDNGVNPSSQNGYKLLDKKQRIKNMVTRIHWFYWTVFETTKTNGKILQSRDVQGGQGLFVYDVR